MNGVLTAKASFRNNKLIILEGLPSNESQTGTWLKNELLDLKYYMEVPEVELVKIASSAQCIEALEKIAFSCLEEGVLPILHFEAHGDKEFIAFPNDQMSWVSLMDYLRIINNCSKGNLGVVMSACEGFHALKPLDIHKSTPFFFLMGSQEIIKVGQIKFNMKEFYKELFSTSDLNAAMDSVEKEFKQYNSETFFFRTLGTVFRRNFVGADRDNRIAAGLSLPHLNYKNLRRKIRRKIYWAAKSHNRASKRKFDQYANVFLPFGHGMTCDLLMSFVWENYRSKNKDYSKSRRVPPKI